jgi:hypothetical protein
MLGLGWTSSFADDPFPSGWQWGEENGIARNHAFFALDTLQKQIQN